MKKNYSAPTLRAKRVEPVIMCPASGYEPHHPHHPHGPFFPFFPPPPPHGPHFSKEVGDAEFEFDEDE